MAVELLRFLGAINVGYVALGALAAAWPESRPAAFTVANIVALART